MSVRGTKRASGVRGDEAGASKRRRTEPEDSLWQLRSVSDLKMSSIYNRGVSEAPAELFRKDLISAMKLPDSEPLTPSGYWVITDTWKQDWERGVQVPVNPDSLPTPKVNIIENPQPPNFHEFKLPRDKYIHLNRDSWYNPEQHQVTSVMTRAEAACAYDLDAVDAAWLKLVNAERARAGVQPLTEDQLERVIEELEVRCWDKIQAIMKSEEGLGIEYDENVICDVCRSPDSEDGNEMVFCDSCNICVHQACYGITVIPPGQWLCRPCGDGVRPTCVLCPNLGGAMKCTPSGHKWAHVSCVLWIPEVSIGCAEKMEPITKISAIPPSRWSLVCVLCRERKGACIQCSVKTCKTAYHVTCAFKHGLEMRAIIEDETAEDGVKLRSYCQKHSVNSKKDKCSGSGSDDEEIKKKRRKDTMTSEEKSQARAARLQEIEREFDRHVSVKDISTHVLDVDQDAIHSIFNYWKLKRRAGHNRPLLPPKSDETDLLTHRQEQADLDKMKMFVQLRQDLERVRNLCYMVSRREKLSRSFFRIREQTFHKQISVLSAGASITGPDLSAIIEANHGPSIYDRLYSHADAVDQKTDFDELLSRIAGPGSSDDKTTDFNGHIKGTKGNPYRKNYVNGSTRRSGSMYSGMSSEESAPEISRTTTKFRATSTDEDLPRKKILSSKKKISPKGKGKKSPKKVGRKRAPQSKTLIDTSSEDEAVQTKHQKDWTMSATLQKMENEMAAGKGIDSGTESDELMPIMRSTRNATKFHDIYSDSSENDSASKAELFSDKSPNATNDSQTLPRTKAAMKEFIPTQPAQKSDKKEPKKRGRKPSSHKEKKTKDSDDEAKNKENIKFVKSKDNPTDLIVPQRQAAKKASENMRTTTVRPKDESTSDRHTSGDDTKSKPKIKSKRDSKDSKEKDVTVKSETKRKMSSDFEKETIAYVPQRQAAKKAAAHIKSGLGSKLPAVETSDEKKKELDKTELIKKSPKKDVEKSVKDLSSSSSSNSSSSSYSSSSSSDDDNDKEEKPGAKPMVKAREIKPATRPLSVQSPTGPRPTVDLPFLDRVSRPLSSTSGSSDSESSKGTKRSGSISPPPKRPRRRRHRRGSHDESSNKAADKKLKTSEPRPERGVLSPSTEGAEPSGANDTRAATRARTRSVTASGNMSDNSVSRYRKPSKDGSDVAPEPNRTSGQESNKPSQLPTPEREANKAINRIKSDSPRTKKHSDSISVDNKSNRHNVLTDDKIKADRNIVKQSPQKGTEQKYKTPPSRRVSAKDILDVVSPNKEPVSDMLIENTSPNKKLSVEIIPIENKLKENEKHWQPKASSPSRQPPAIEKHGGHEKYMTEDKGIDSDFADKSSIKMIAKIQANLNENTMIKSPKTPMDARMMVMDPMDFEHPMGKNVRKRTESDKKYMNQEVHLQGVEISKRAKIPSTINPYPKRSIFSPQPKENELFELENMISVDDGFNQDDIMKPFAAYPDSFFFKEDSKEQGVQETRNLVDRLRMQYKKASVDDPPNDRDIDEDMPSETIANEKDTRLKESPADTIQSHKDDYAISNHAVHAPSDISGRGLPCRDMQTMSDVQRVSEPYDHSMSFNEDTRGPTGMQSETATDNERDTGSKQSDDSQSLSVVDHSVHSNDQESVTQDPNNYDNNNSLLHSDCATISSPYVSQDSKWHESKITHRRSSASSTDTDGSICSQRPIIKPIPGSVMTQEMGPYPPMPAYSCSIEPPMPLNQYSNYPPDSPFITSMSALPMFSSASTLPLASPGGPLFPTAMSIPYCSSPLVTSLSKPSFPTLGAAFTSSSQNIAITTAMIAPPTPKPMDSPRDDHDTTGSDKFSVHVVSSPSVDSYNENNSRSVPSKTNENSSETITNLQIHHTKSPSKPAIKPVTKFAGKSPGKSPRFSPKQAESTKGSNKRSSNKGNRSQRGRGRAKSRAATSQSYPHNIDLIGNSIQSKLVGTPYDFDEEIANDGVGLKSLRERRKSIDNSDRKSEASYKDASQSPHIASPQPNKRSSTAVDKDSKHASPAPEVNTTGSPVKSSSDRNQTFPPVVQPVLPGPVDMRTYQPLESATPTATAGDGYHSHLLAFASGTADQQLAEIDEEIEKQLHSALMSSKPEEAPVPPVETKVTQETIPIPQHPRVSLMDSRNQLKVKIKGPFLDANYSTSSVPQAAPQPSAPIVDRGPSNYNVTNTSATSAMGGSTNLRRMRKKELLRQYWNQDMNMDEPINPPPQAAAPQPYARPVITIPKAVTSMTSIPTREDYKIFDTHVEKKKRKTSGIAREVGNLGISMNDAIEHTDESRYSYNAASQLSNKRRGRVNNKPNKVPTSSPVAPKLRIKIGAKFVQPVETEEPISDYQLRPPKKRLACIQTPSIEDLRRESMKYRKMVMADFEHEEVKKHKPNKSEKRKKKKDKKTDKIQVVKSDSDSATKLIIKIKRTKEEEARDAALGVGEGSAGAASAVSEPPVDPFEYDPSAPDPLAIDPPSNPGSTTGLRNVRTAKVTPIRLKLARSAEGSGYVMQDAPASDAATDATKPLTNCQVR